MVFRIFSSNKVTEFDVFGEMCVEKETSRVLAEVTIEDGYHVLDFLVQYADVYVNGFPFFEPLPIYMLNLKSINPKIYMNVYTDSGLEKIAMLVYFPSNLIGTATYFKLKYGGS